MPRKSITLEFKGIDQFNRPVFYSKEVDAYFGSVNELFPHDATKEEVLSTITDFDICYFGKSFGCEPCGGGELQYHFCIRKD